MAEILKYLNGLIEITPNIIKDGRGYFFESYNKNNFKLNDVNFVQDNESCSSKNVVRGIHYQSGDFAQAKLVRVVKGAVVDFALDLRKSSLTFGEMYFVLLTEENKKQFYIPRGFAHGFVSLKDDTIFSYKCDNFWNKASEQGVNILDPNLRVIEKIKNTFPEINLNENELIFSDKDKIHPFFKDQKVLFD